MAAGDPPSSCSPAPPGSGRARTCTRRSTSCSSTRPARSRSPTRSRCPAAPAASCCSATRSSSPHVSQGTHPRGSGVSVLEHLLDGHDTVAAGSRRLPRPHVAHAPGRLRLGLAHDVRRPAAGAGPLRAPDASTGLRRRPAHDRGRARGQPHERRRRRPSGSRRRSSACSRRPVHGRRRHHARADARRHPRRRAVQRPGALPARAAARGRADRHRRQVPGAGGAGRLLLDDELHRRGRPARHGLPVQPQPPQRGGLARAGARVVVCSPRLLWAPCSTVEQMPLVNALCTFAEAARG